jgi:hypothetical protein
VAVDPNLWGDLFILAQGYHVLYRGNGSLAGGHWIIIPGQMLVSHQRRGF